MVSLDATAASLLRDPQYLLRLHRKVVQRIVQRDASTSVRTLAPLFAQIDARYRDRSRAAPTESWLLRGVLRQIFPAAALSDRELSVLFALLPFDETDGDVRASPVSLLLCLRRLCPLRATMLLEIIRTIDAAPPQRPSASLCGRALSAQRRRGSGACAMDTGELVDFLVEAFGLTLSAALFLVEYCAAESNGGEKSIDIGGGSVAVDGEYMYAMLFRRPLPANVHYALLMSVFAEAAADPNREKSSGTRALVEELRRVPLDGGDDGKEGEKSNGANGAGRPSGDDTKREKHCATEDDADLDVCIDAADIAGRRLSSTSFESLCAALRVGLSPSDVQRLFYYLRDESRASLSVRTLFREFLRHFPPASASLFGILRAAVRQCVAKAGGLLALPRLFLALPRGPLPIGALVAALRGAGVPGAVSDAELEWLRFAGRDRAGLVLALAGRVPASRAALVRQLFEQICGVERGPVTGERVVARFSPEKVGDAVIHKAAEWRETMARCFAAAREVLSFEQFAFFWCAVSAACDDDSVFTMILWRCFAMHTSRP